MSPAIEGSRFRKEMVMDGVGTGVRSLEDAAAEGDASGACQLPDRRTDHGLSSLGGKISG